MGPSSRSFSSRGWNGFRRLTKVQTPASVSFRAVRAVLLAAIASSMLIYVPTRSATPARVLQTSFPACASRKIDLAFLIDHSASMMIRSDPNNPDGPARGQTYNTELAGVIRALRDPTVIPRDGSVAVAVVIFAEDAVVRVPLGEIVSAEIAEQIAKRVADLMCPCDGGSIEPCPFGETNYGAAITVADNHLNQNHREGAHRVFLMATDGYPMSRTDPTNGRAAAVRAADMNSELDVFLMGLNPGNVAQLINGLPGKSLTIEPGVCNEDGAGCTGNSGKLSNVASDCDRQACDFAELTRGVLRGVVKKITVVVNTEADPPPNTPVRDNSLSLRQAIELANCNGGATTITFECNVKPISPVIPLPALTAPEITIDGLAGRDQKCTPVTIDGSSIDTRVSEAPSDGILIRSFNDIVRGLRIVKFNRAGIAIEPIRQPERPPASLTSFPILQLDNVASNLIEFNKLEDNGSAGVLVRDPDLTRPSAVFHNVGNTISQNTISGSGALIDLGGDGVTLNDPADADEGPNTLLNYPESFTADTTGANVTFIGKVNLSTAACRTNDAVVEIFSVTKIRNASGVAVVQAVKPFARIIVNKNSGGAFSATFTKESMSDAELNEASCPIDGYTATFTDEMGNTSELIPFCTGPAVARIDPERLKFGKVDLAGNPGGAEPSHDFTIQNCGCSTLNLSAISTERTGKDVDNKRIAVKNDLLFFPVSPVDSMSLAPGESRTLSVKFKPVIPAVITKDQEARDMGLSAKDVLADRLVSVVTLGPGSSRALPLLTLIGNVTTDVKLIDPDDTSKPPKVTLKRLGDNLMVTFAVFDSDLSVKKVDYEFFKVRNNECTDERVLAEIPDHDLRAPMNNRTPKLITGQSFTVIQPFSGANDNPDAGCVRVTVWDENTSDSAISLPASLSRVSASFASTAFRRQEGAALVRPAIKLPSRRKEIRETRPRDSGDRKGVRQ